MSTTRLPRIERGRRTRARFLSGPSRSTQTAQSAVNSDAVGPTLTWAGTDVSLEAIVRDHAQAAGLHVGSESMTSAPAVVVCDAQGLDALRVPEKSSLIVVSATEPGPDIWRAALAKGAHSVRSLPEESVTLLDELTALAQQPLAARVIVCMPGSGGAGASSLTARLVRAATRLGTTPLLIDADPYGGGIDVLVESAHARGARWDALTHAGDGAAGAILDSLPVIDGTRVLTFPPAHSGAAAPGIDAIARVCRALSTETELVVIDAPALPYLLTLLPAHEVIVQTLGTGHGLSAAKRRIDGLRANVPTGELSLALRHPRGPHLYRAPEVESMLDAPVALEFSSSPASHVPSLDTRRTGADAACLAYMKELLR